MRAQLQQQIAPPTVKNSMDLSSAPVTSSDKALDSNAPPKADFRSLLGNSNSEIARERAAKKAGDFSGAKTEEEFFKMLSDRANPTTAPKNKLDKDDFLKLFVAQMKYQNPLNPDDSSQMAAQLAQFNGLEQMLNVNKTLEEMKKAQEVGRAVGMLDYIGKEVSMDGGKVRLDQGKVNDTTFTVGSPIAEATLEVRDGAGAVVAKKSLGPINPGDHALDWDGKDATGKQINDGVYSFSIIGRGMDGSDVAVDLKTKVKITGVDLKETGGSFFTEVGKVKVQDVNSVGIAGYARAAKIESDAKKSSKPQNQDGTVDTAPISGEAPAVNTELTVQGGESTAGDNKSGDNNSGDNKSKEMEKMAALAQQMLAKSAGAQGAATGAGQPGSEEPAR
jgi:flagellar basal-body rod modification protein FlgD